MPLSDTSVRAAKSKEKPYKLSDSGGLYLWVSPSGGRHWRLKYRLYGKEKTLSLGAYPTIGLKEARDKRDAAKRLLESGVDPSLDKKKRRSETHVASSNTFDTVAKEFMAKRLAEGITEATERANDRFYKFLSGPLGARPIAAIEPADLLDVLKKIERSGRYESAKRVASFADRVYRYAIITGRAKINPASHLSEALVAPTVKNFAAIVDPKKFGGLLRAIDGYDGHPTTQIALKLLPHVFVRPGELRKAVWSEFDLDGRVWRIPAGRMKMRNEHAVPLSKQSLELIKELASFKGPGDYLFPTPGSWLKPMSENAINGALRRLGYSGDEMTAHGFRSSASTLLNESGLWSPDAIERALAHFSSGSVRGIYHRGAHWQERVQMAQWWSDYIEGLKADSGSD